MLFRDNRRRLSGFACLTAAVLLQFLSLPPVFGEESQAAADHLRGTQTADDRNNPTLSGLEEALRRAGREVDREVITSTAPASSSMPRGNFWAGRGQGPLVSTPSFAAGMEESEEVRLFREQTGFTLISHLGGGIEGDVYRAQGPQGEERAVKINQSRGVGLAVNDNLEHFRNRLQGKTHPAIPQVYGTGEVSFGPYQKLTYQVYEFRKGERVFDLVKTDFFSSRLGPKKSVDVIRSIAEGLDFLYRHEIALGDFHGEQVLVDENGAVSMLDILSAYWEPEKPVQAYIPGNTSEWLAMASQILGSLELKDLLEESDRSKALGLLQSAFNRFKRWDESALSEARIYLDELRDMLPEKAVSQGESGPEQAAPPGLAAGIEEEDPEVRKLRLELWDGPGRDNQIMRRLAHLDSSLIGFREKLAGSMNDLLWAIKAYRDWRNKRHPRGKDAIGILANYQDVMTFISHRSMPIADLQRVLEATVKNLPLFVSYGNGPWVASVVGTELALAAEQSLTLMAARGVLQILQEKQEGRDVLAQAVDKLFDNISKEESVESVIELAWQTLATFLENGIAPEAIVHHLNIYEEDRRLFSIFLSYEKLHPVLSASVPRLARALLDADEGTHLLFSEWVADWDREGFLQGSLGNSLKVLSENPSHSEQDREGVFLKALAALVSSQPSPRLVLQLVEDVLLKEKTFAWLKNAGDPWAVSLSFDLERLQHMAGEQGLKWLAPVLSLLLTEPDEGRLKERWTELSGHLRTLLSSTTDYNREKILSLLFVGKTYDKTHMDFLRAQQADLVAHVKFYAEVLSREKRLGYQLLEGILAGMTDRDVVDPQLPPEEQERIMAFVGKMRSFSPGLFLLYKRGEEAVLQDLAQFSQQFLLDQVDSKTVDNLMTKSKEHGINGLEVLATAIQIVMPASGRSFVKRGEIQSLLGGFVQAGDLRSHVPEDLRNRDFGRGEKDAITSNEWRLRPGLAFDPDGKLNQLLVDLRYKDQQLSTEESAKQVEQDRQKFITALSMYFRDRSPERKQDAQRAFYAYASHNDRLGEKVDRIPYGEYQGLNLLEELFVDKDNLYVLLAEILKELDPILFPHVLPESTGAITDATGLARRVKGIWGSGLPGDQKMVRIGRALEGIASSEIEQKLLPKVDDEELKKQIQGIAQSPQLGRPAHWSEIGGDLFEEPAALIQREKERFELVELDKKVVLEFRVVKGIPYGLWGHNCGVCIYDDLKLWKDPRFKLLAFIDKIEGKVVGFAHLFEAEAEGGKVLTVPGIEPTVEFLSEVKAREVYPLIERALIQVASEGGYKALYFPTDRHILSNRPDVIKEIEKRYSSQGIPLPTPIHWNHRPNPYPFKEVYKIWSRDAAGLEEVAVKAFDLNALKEMGGDAVRLAEEANRANFSHVVLIPDMLLGKPAAPQEGTIRLYYTDDDVKVRALGLLPTTISENQIEYHRLPSDLAELKAKLQDIPENEPALVALDVGLRGSLPEKHPLVLLLDQQWGSQLAYQEQLRVLLNRPIQELRNLVVFLSEGTVQKVKIGDRDYTAIFA